MRNNRPCCLVRQISQLPRIPRAPHHSYQKSVYCSLIRGINVNGHKAGALADKCGTPNPTRWAQRGFVEIGPSCQQAAPRMAGPPRRQCRANNASYQRGHKVLLPAVAMHPTAEPTLEEPSEGDEIEGAEIDECGHLCGHGGRRAIRTRLSD
jgi:hypothetical protein